MKPCSYCFSNLNFSGLRNIEQHQIVVLVCFYSFGFPFIWKTHWPHIVSFWNIITNVLLGICCHIAPQTWGDSAKGVSLDKTPWSTYVSCICIHVDVHCAIGSPNKFHLNKLCQIYPKSHLLNEIITFVFLACGWQR